MNVRSPATSVASLALVMWMLFVGACHPALGFEDEAHRAFGFAAVDASRLDGVLKHALRLQKGTAEDLEGPNKRNFLVAGPVVTEALPAARWLSEGSTDEDVPAQRVLNHFHEPRKDWSTAGLRSTLFNGESSIVWAHSNEGGGGARTWFDARAAYYEALTKKDPQERERALAATLYNLGHVLHHVQDAASPAHTRNDIHLPGNSDGFHIWGEKSAGLIAGIAGIGYGRTLIDQDPPLGLTAR